MNETILVVEDEKRMNELISAYFKKEGYNVIMAFDGAEGLKAFNNNSVDLAILDVMMPYMDGFTLCKKIRESNNTPVIILTARGEEDDKLFGYDLGADDYIVKPVSPRVLVAKGKALIKRAAPSEKSGDDIHKFGELTINEPSHEVALNGNTIILSPKEYDLLLYFIKNEGIVLTRDKLLDGVWGMDYFGDLRTVDTHVKRLREKLLDYAYIIQTIRGMGYKFSFKEK